jgi:ureidoacrylate peracid hydrolase
VHGEVLTELGAKVRPDHTALVVVDMQNDFCADGGLMAQDGIDLEPVQAMANRVVSILEAARQTGVLVVFVRNTYSTEANWYLSGPWLEVASRRYSGEAYTKRDMCRPDSWNSDFYSDIRPRADEPIVTKHRYSAFHNTDLDLILRTHGIRTLVLVGVATNVCVETTVREGFIRDYYIVVPREGTAAYSREAYETSLRNMDMYFGEVVTVDDLLSSWSVPSMRLAEERANLMPRPTGGQSGR